MTHGTDTYVGGGGYDTVTYEGRTEDLSLSPDGVAERRRRRASATTSARTSWRWAAATARTR